MKSVLKIIVCITLMAIILSKVDYHLIIELVQHITWLPIVLAFLVGIVQSFLVTWRWQILIQAQHHRISFRQTLGVMFVSGFIGSFLPSGLGADAVRIWLMKRYDVNILETIASTLVDRLAGLFVLLVLTFGSVIYLLTTTIKISTIVIGAPILGLIMFFAVIFMIRLELLKHWLTKYGQKWGLLKKLENCRQAVQAYERNRKGLCKVLIISVAVQGARILYFYFLGLSIGTTVSIGWFCILSPPIILITFIPISIGGLGTREGAFVYFFSLVGMEGAEAFTISILSYVMTIVSGAIIGSYFFMVSDISVAKAKREIDPT